MEMTNPSLYAALFLCGVRLIWGLVISTSDSFRKEAVPPKSLKKKFEEEPRPESSHFFALPLHIDPDLRRKVGDFQRELIDAKKETSGLDTSIVVDPRRLHITVGVVGLRDDLDVDRALKLVRSLQPQMAQILNFGKTVRVKLDKLDILQPDPQGDPVARFSHVLFVGPSDNYLKSWDGKCLKMILELVYGELDAAGFISERRTSKIHCSLLNTRYRRPRGIKLPFSYSDILDSPACQYLALKRSPSSSGTARVIELRDVEMGEIQLWKFGSHTANNEYVCCGSVPFSTPPRLDIAAASDPESPPPQPLITSNSHPQPQAVEILNHAPQLKFSKTVHPISKQDSPRISKISEGNLIYNDLLQSLKKNWDGDSAPKIKAVYDVQPAESLKTAFEEYQKRVEATGHFLGRRNKSGQRMLAGNEKRAFFGAKRACSFGDNSTISCTNEDCELCVLISSGFKFAPKSPVNPKSGLPILVYRVPAKAASNIINVGHASGSPFKVLLVCQVIVGRSYDTFYPERHSTCRSGYDSVFRKTDDGSRESFGEFFLYDSDAISVVNLIVFH